MYSKITAVPSNSQPPLVSKLLHYRVKYLNVGTLDTFSVRVQLPYTL